MADIDALYTTKFSRVIQSVLQAKGGKLSGAIDIGSYRGESAEVVKELGYTVAEKAEKKFEDYSIKELPWYSRWVYPELYTAHAMISKTDLLQTEVDPTSAEVETIVTALRRTQDDLALASIVSAAKTGAKGNTTTNYDSNMTVPETSTATGMTVAKLKSIINLLEENDVDLDNETIHLAVTSKAKQQLLGEIQLIDGAFNGGMSVLKNGKLPNYLGFEFHSIQFANDKFYKECKGLFGTASARTAPFWVKSGVHLGIWDDVSSKVVPMELKKGSPYLIKAEMYLGATRVNEKKVGLVTYDETK